MTSEIELALVDGRVRTLDPDNPSAQAVAVAGGRIAAVGSDAEVRALCGPGTEVMELDGAQKVINLRMVARTHLAKTLIDSGIPEKRGEGY